ncbi:arsenate reductase (azurin) small subunit [Diaphorobacter ruginosibacter]|uniref:Arsenate reductase (Azurin) small subunit n=1 Tax=Diaphorobacter ruginosibacter TaxID=1715720 RepID=A0A7G9RQN8_9BURK|nr:arsenate reductase (azurin) small subunit [Diaphorobacter ruginosibacter]QNN57913.1 arsenate reductase (azurin) small subunit [Diaphorobacter ruginosibacter]
MEDVKIARRFFLKSGGMAAAAVGTGGAVIPIHVANAATPANASGTTLPYPRKAVSKISGMKVNEVTTFMYPDDSSPCYALRMDTPVVGGVGPKGDIVAFSAMCTHMGCPVTYDGGSRTFKCGCHFTIFDPEKGGQMVCGQATEDLPKILLEYDNASGTVTAVGVDGLIFGRQANIL